VNSVFFAEDGRTLASGSSDGTAKLWNTDSARELATFAGGAGEVHGVVLSKDGKLLAAGNRYGTVRVWDVASKKALATLKGHTGDVWAVAFAPDGKTLAAGGGDWDQPGEIKLWDTAKWQERATLKHDGEVLCLAFAPDGKTLAAGSWAKSVKLWTLPGSR
jgi:WD40 repeat protein